MASQVRPGQRLRSMVCDTEVIVVRAPSGEIAVECGGVEMAPIEATRPAGASPAPELSGGTALGKRHGSVELGLEVLCTKAGEGTLACDGDPLPELQAKSLPASD